LVTGTDGNTIRDECGQETPAGSALSFSVKDTVSAAFTYDVVFGCKKNTINCTHPGTNGVNKWQWSFDNGTTRTTKDASAIYTTYGRKQMQLAVTNGFCSDIATASFLLDNELKAQFTLFPDVLCPEDFASFKDTSSGKITSWYWNFGNGSTSNLQTPPTQSFSSAERDKEVPVQLIVQDSYNCFDTAVKKIKVLYNCYIAVPTAFTPNGDGRNDHLHPLNAYKADNLEFNVYNRYGQLIFKTKDWTHKWDGTINNIPQLPGVYVWMLKYTHHDTGKKYFLKGTTVLIR
jgi:gliding motility-associated-like protein